MPDEKNVELIAADTILPIEVSSGFYSRVAQMAEYLVKTNCTVENELDYEKIRTAHQQIESGTVGEDWVRHYETCLIFVYEFEKIATEKGMIVKEV